MCQKTLCNLEEKKNSQSIDFEIIGHGAIQSGNNFTEFNAKFRFGKYTFFHPIRNMN